MVKLVVGRYLIITRKWFPYDNVEKLLTFYDIRSFFITIYTLCSRVRVAFVEHVVQCYRLYTYVELNFLFVLLLLGWLYGETGILEGSHGSVKGQVWPFVDVVVLQPDDQQSDTRHHWGQEPQGHGHKRKIWWVFSLSRLSTIIVFSPSRRRDFRRFSKRYIFLIQYQIAIFDCFWNTHK